jgi:hypothetical protein
MFNNLPPLVSDTHQWPMAGQPVGVAADSGAVAR